MNGNNVRVRFHSGTTMKQIWAGFEKVDMDYVRKVQEGEDVKLEQFTKWIEFNRRGGLEELKKGLNF